MTVNLVIIGLVSFVAMEGVSYVLHRFVYHGFAWRIHRSHHRERKGAFELNDVFPAILSVLTICLFVYALSTHADSVAAAAVGITAYGLVYFLIHDLYIHRRAGWLKLRIPFLIRLKQAHAIHHRYGGEPYGLLLFFRPGNVNKDIDAGEDDA